MLAIRTAPVNLYNEPSRLTTTETGISGSTCLTDTYCLYPLCPDAPHASYTSYIPRMLYIGILTVGPSRDAPCLSIPRVAVVSS